MTVSLAERLSSLEQMVDQLKLENLELKNQVATWIPYLKDETMEAEVKINYLMNESQYLDRDYTNKTTEDMLENCTYAI